MSRGHFIVVEGLEGAGKSTAVRTIQTFFNAQKQELLTTREPGGTHTGEIVRNLLKNAVAEEPLDARAELLLFYAARVQLLEQVIRPALQQGTWVLADRFELSTFAYQGGGRGLDEQMIAQLSAFCVRDLVPDLTLFLEISPKLGLQRAKNRGKMDRIEREPLSFFEAVHRAYHQQLKRVNHVVMIDASKSLPRVQAAIRSALEQYMVEQQQNA